MKTSSNKICTMLWPVIGFVERRVQEKSRETNVNSYEFSLSINFSLDGTKRHSKNLIRFIALKLLFVYVRCCHEHAFRCLRTMLEVWRQGTRFQLARIAVFDRRKRLQIREKWSQICRFHVYLQLFMLDVTQGGWYFLELLLLELEMLCSVLKRRRRDGSYSDEGGLQLFQRRHASRMGIQALLVVGINLSNHNSIQVIETFRRSCNSGGILHRTSCLSLRHLSNTLGNLGSVSDEIGTLIEGRPTFRP